MSEERTGIGADEAKVEREAAEAEPKVEEKVVEPKVEEKVGHTPPPAPHLSVRERAARGRAARAEVPRSRHGEFEPAAGRPDPVALLESQSANRVPDLVPIRYGRMLVSAFTFYRGGALIMASDLASTPTSGLNAQLCGDAHLSNFGGFGTPERRMVFDCNDFDETLPGPWEWDVKRLAASLVVAGRDNEFSAKESRGVTLGAVGAYRRAMAKFAGMSNLAVWYAHLDIDSLVPDLDAHLDKKRVRLLNKDLAKARTKDSLHAFQKLTTMVDGEPRIVSDPPLTVPVEEFLTEDRARLLDQQFAEAIRRYRTTLRTDLRSLVLQFRFVQLAHRIVGVGSVGTRCWIVLFLGRDESDPLILQAKEANESVLERFVGRSRYKNHGQRVVMGQRYMQQSSDIFLGWDRIPAEVTLEGTVDRDFYIRQFRDWKFSAEVGAMPPPTLTEYAKLCAWTLARAHARTGDRIAIAAYLGKSDAFDRAVADFAESYADQNERDYAAFVQAVNSGRLKAQTGV